MKRKIALLLACMLTAGLISGCGSSKTADTSSSAGTSVSDSTVPSVSEGTNTSDNIKTSETAKPSDTSAAADTSETVAPSDSSPTESSQKVSDTEQPSTSAPDSQPAAESSTEDTPQESQPGITIDEDGNIIIDPNVIEIGDESEPEESEEADTKDESDFLDLSYQMTYLSPAGFSTGTQLPAAYYITSPAELNDFIETFNKTYSLDVGYSNDDYIEKISFVTKSKDMDESYFSVTDALIVVAAYDKSEECDLGSISVKDDAVSAEIWAQKPAAAEQTGYVCFVVNVEKNVLKGKTVTAFVNDDFLSEEDE